MKKVKIFMKALLTISLAVLVFLGVSPQNVFASDVSYTTLTVTANVNAEYDGDIAFVFTQKDSGFNYQLLLTKDKNYTGTLSIVGDMEYIATITLKKNADSFKVTGISDSYKISGTDVKFDFAVEKGLSMIQENTVTESPVSANTETETESTNLSSAEASYQDYINSVSFMDGNSDFDSFLKNYDNDIMKKYFLEADSTNTENDWKTMSSFEKFNYYILYIRTKNLIVGENAVTSEADLLSKLSSESALLGNVKDGEVVTDAIRTIWSWEWKNWEQTGEFVNLYDPFTEGSVQKHTETELTDEDNAEIKEAQKELKQEDTTADRVKKDLIRNVLSLCILACVGISILVVIIIRRKKNYDNIED